MTEFTKIEVMLNNRDVFGNELVTEEVAEGIYDLRLKQANENRYRMIGSLIVSEEDTLYLKSEKEEDKYLKTKAWTIHASILSYCTTIQYDTDLAIYSITTQDAKRHGNYFTYERNSHTTKLIVPIRYWDIAFKDTKSAFLADNLGYEWFDELREEFEKPYMVQLSRFIASRRHVTNVYPSKEDLFKAFRLTPFMDVRVVIIGQDPYHGPNEANGLSFAVNTSTLKIPPSLQNINKEIESDYDEGFSLYKRINLENWAKQGVLLLNTCLTVEEGKPGSHGNIGWQRFTMEAVRKLIKRNGKPIVFMLWGKYAQENFIPLINGTKHLALTAPHPSPYSAHTGFFGCKHFTKCNEFLKNTAQNFVNW